MPSGMQIRLSRSCLHIVIARLPTAADSRADAPQRERPEAAAKIFSDTSRLRLEV